MVEKDARVEGDVGLGWKIDAPEPLKFCYEVPDAAPELQRLSVLLQVFEQMSEEWRTSDLNLQRIANKMRGCKEERAAALAYLQSRYG